METQSVVMDAENEVKVRGIDLAEAARRAWLAGIGAMASAQDEVVALVNKMIERGEITEKEGRKWVEQWTNKAKKVPQKSLKSAGGGVHAQVDALLDRIGVPTKADIERMDLPTRADIEALSEKVAVLSRKIDQLRKVEKDQSAVLEKEALSDKVDALAKKVDQLRKVEKEQTAMLEKVEVQPPARPEKPEKPEKQQAPKPEKVSSN